MSRWLNTPRACLFFLLGTVAAAGCKPPLPPMAPVKGKVTLDGQPVTSGQVSFVPADEKTGAGESAGTIGADGAYEIHTAGQSGAPLGKYKVTVTPDMSKAMQGGMTMPFPQKYGDPRNTPLQVEVINSPEQGRYDLKMTK
jgi:hypothetical protein